LQDGTDSLRDKLSYSIKNWILGTFNLGKEEHSEEKHLVIVSK